MDKKLLFLYSLVKDSRIDNGDDILAKWGNIDYTQFDDILSKATEYVSAREENVYASQLNTIFSKLGASEKSYPFAKLAIEESNIFPISITEQDESAHINLYNESVSKIVGIEPQIFADTLFAIQKQYLWCVLSDNAIDTPVISEYEFLKSRAAFAQCLATDHKDTTFPFLLFCADISGIQSFIYDIHSRKAAKSIKGRSFYLQLLIDSIIQRIVYEADVSKANVIYSSGGKFFMLLPNTPQVVEKIKSLESEIAKNLFEEYQGSLYVCMATLAFGYDEKKNITCPENLRDGNKISSLLGLWKTISDKTSHKKQNKFFKLLQDSNRFSEFFEGNFNENYNGQNMAVCAVTGRPTKAIKENEIDNGVYVLPQVKEQTLLGESLKDAIYYETVHFIKGNGFKEWIEPIKLKVFHNLPETKNQTNDYCFQSIINPTEQTDINKIASQYRSAGLLFYGGNQQAENSEGEWKTFEELVETDTNKNFRKLAIVRMDVDNLGNIFNNQMIEELGSFACYSTLSAMFDLFFGGYLNTIRNNGKYKDYVNILYAGGDDVCAVGRWDKIIEFTIEVRKKFAEFVGDEKAITISAGVVLVNPKFPISKAIDMAADALDTAKKHQTPKQIADKQRGIKDEYDKNNFHLLDETISWELEVDFVFALSKKLEELLANNTISKGFIYKLFAFKSLKDEGKLDWWWQSAYFFAKQAKDKEAQKVFFESVKNALVTGKFEFGTIKNNQPTRERMLDLICLSAKLADIYSR